MICGFVTVIAFGLMFPSIQVAECQRDTAECISHINYWISRIPEQYIESEAVVVYNRRCELVPRRSPLS